MTVRSLLVSLVIAMFSVACSDPDGRASGSDVGGDGSMDLDPDMEAPDDGAEDVPDVDSGDDPDVELREDAGADLADDVSADLAEVGIADDAAADVADDAVLDAAADTPSDLSTDARDAADVDAWDTLGHDGKPDPDLGGDAGVDVVEDAEVGDTDGGAELDVLEPNDAWGDASEVELDFSFDGLSIHDGDDADWFRFTLGEDSGLEVRVLFSQASGDLDVHVFDGSVAELSRGDSISDNEIVTLAVLAPGDYYVRVHGYLGATNDYDIRLVALEPVDTDALFADLTVQNLQDPRVFFVDGMQVLGLVSYIGNIGTAGAPGGAVGNGSARFRLIEAETGAVILEGDKGPVYFTNNGGCSGEAYAEWVASGWPQLPGAEAAPTFTNPGCVDIYTQETNAQTTPPLDIGDRELVPNGDYYYELEVDPDDSYAFEADFTRANNSGRVPIRIGSAGAARTVTQTGVIVRSGRLSLDSGTASTVLGDGRALGILGDTFLATAAIGAPGAVGLDTDGRLLVTLLDDGSLVRREPDDSWSRLVSGLDEPMGFDLFDNNDAVIVETAADRLTLALAADGYATVSEIVLAGAALNAPTDVRVGPAGLLYIANSGAHVVLSVDPETGEATVVAGTGEAGYDGDGGATAVRLSRPSGLDLRDDGLLVIAEAHNNRLRAVNLNDAGEIVFASQTIAAGELVTLAGMGPTGAQASLLDNGTDGFVGEGRHGRTATLDLPFAPRIAAGRVFFLDTDNHRVRCLDEHGAIRVVMGDAPLPDSNGPRDRGSDGVDLGDGGPGLEADVNHPLGLAVVADDSGGFELLIADADHYRVRRVVGLRLDPTYPAD